MRITERWAPTHRDATCDEWARTRVRAYLRSKASGVGPRGRVLRRRVVRGFCHRPLGGGCRYRVGDQGLRRVRRHHRHQPPAPRAGRVGAAGSEPGGGEQASRAEVAAGPRPPPPPPGPPRPPPATLRAKRCMPGRAEGGSAGCCQIAWTLMDSVSTGLTGVSEAAQATTRPFETSSSLSGPVGADLSQ